MTEWHCQGREGSNVGNNQTASTWGVGIGGEGRMTGVIAVCGFLSSWRKTKEKKKHPVFSSHNKHFPFLLLKTPHSTSQGLLGLWASNSSALGDKRGQGVALGLHPLAQKFSGGGTLRQDSNSSHADMV